MNDLHELEKDLDEDCTIWHGWLAGSKIGLNLAD
jgi:hypothetical protein